jgi:hypothetical protein
MDAKTSDLFCQIEWNGEKKKTKTKKNCLRAIVDELLIFDVQFDYIQ